MSREGAGVPPEEAVPGEGGAAPGDTETVRGEAGNVPGEAGGVPGEAVGATGAVEAAPVPDPVETPPPIGKEGRAAPPAAGGADRRAAPGAPAPRRRGRGLAVLVTALIVVVGGAAVTVGFLLSPPSATPRPVEFEVMPGWGGKRVAQELAAAGLVRSALAFDYYLRFRGLDTAIGEGLYDLDPTLSAREIAAALAAGGRPRTATVVVPEGWRADAVVARLAANGIATAEELAALVAEPGLELAPPYAPADQGLEGYLFPASYEVPLHATAEEALRLMVDRFRAEVAVREGLAERLGELGLTVHQWVTLASLVQAEAADASEMPIIAGVFLNRLELGMPLQSDPTVAYGLGKPLPELSAVAGDLRVDTPWNTYTRPGLPVGPIGNPGAEALDAVLAPERYAPDGALYLYFLHGTDEGRPVFRPNTNLPAHNRDVDAYLRGR